MFCPNCGQQQASGETRFCSRCGFQLGVVKALLAAGEGEGPGVRPVPDQARRRKDMTKGAAFMFLAALIVAAGTVELPPGNGNKAAGQPSPPPPHLSKLPRVSARPRARVKWREL